LVSRRLNRLDAKIDAQKTHRNEFLSVADMVAREKGIEKEQVLEAMQQAIQRAARTKYGSEYDVRACIDHITGDLTLLKVLTVVDEVEDARTQIIVKNARLKCAEAQIGDELEEELPPISFGRIAAQAARQVIFQKVRGAERERQQENLQDKVGYIVSGTVKRIEYGNVIVDLGQAEGVIRRDDLIPRETFRPDDRVRAVLTKLNTDARGPIACLSRIDPLMMARLFEQEVPEIYEGSIEIKSVARDPGSRAKMSVYTADETLDPVGSCVGVRGSRVQSVIDELQGEKVDIVMWSEDVASYIVNALQPAEVAKVVIDEEKKQVDVIVAEDQLSLAIGRRGQNVRLASILTGWRIDILTEEEDITRRLQENKALVQLFQEQLDVDEMLAQLLCNEGFLTVDEVAYIDLAEFATIEGFDADLAEELQKRALEAVARNHKKINSQIKKLKVDQQLVDLVEKSEFLDLNTLEIFMNNKIITLDDLAELSSDELIDVLGKNSVSQDAANAIIMDARKHWFTGN
jgi:N utilization substance protein A